MNTRLLANYLFAALATAVLIPALGCGSTPENKNHKNHGMNHKPSRKPSDEKSDDTDGELSTELEERPMKYSPNGYTTKLDNGLDVIIIPDRRLPITNVGMAVKTGAISETPETNGIAHLYEHMTLNANKAFPTEKQFEEHQKKLGVLSNASTSAEVVRYYFSLPADNFANGVKMLRHVIRDPLFKEEELKGERNIVINEYDKRTGDPSRKLSRRVTKALFHKYPWRRSTLGEREIIKKATTEDLENFHRKYYRPNNACFLVVGDVDPENALSTIKEEFNDWKPKKDLKTQEDLPPHPDLEEDRIVRVVSDKQKNATISIEQHAPSVLDNPEATYAADVWGTILGLSSSKFQENLVDNGPFQTASLGYYTQKDGPQITFYGNTNSDDLEEALEAYHREIQKFDQPDYFTKSDVEAAKKQLIVDRKFSAQNSREYLQTIGFWWAVAGFNYFQNYIDNLKKVTLQNVRRFCKNHVLNQHRVYGFLLPKGKAKELDLTGNNLSKLVQNAKAGENGDSDQDGATGEGEGNLRGENPEDGETTPSGEQDNTEEFTLDSGVPVIHRRITENDVVSVQLFIDGGTMNTRDLPAGIEQFFLRVIQRGTEQFPLPKIKSLKDRNGIKITSDSNYDYSRFLGNCLVEDLDTTVDMMASMVNEPLIKKDQVDYVREQMMLSVKQRMSDPSRQMWFETNKLLFRNHPYRNLPDGTIESLKNINRKQLVAYRDRLFRTGKLLFSVVGNVSRNELKSRLNNTFDFVESDDVDRKQVPSFRTEDDQKTNIVNKEGLETAFVVGKFPAISITHDEYASLKIGLEVLSDRIYEETRTKRGLTYGAYAGLAYYRSNWGYFYITTPRPNLGVALIHREIKKMKEEPVEEEELQKTANMQYTRQLLRRQTSSTQANLLGRAEIQGLGWENQGNILEEMRSADPEAIQEAMQTHVSNIFAGVIQGKEMKRKAQKQILVNPEKALEYLRKQTGKEENRQED